MTNVCNSVTISTIIKWDISFFYLILYYNIAFASVLFWFFGCRASGILSPQPVTSDDPEPLAVGGEILTTRLPGKSQDPTAFQPFSKKKKELPLLRSNLKILREGLLLALLGYTSIHFLYQSLLPPGLCIPSMGQSMLPEGRGKSWYVGSSIDHRPNFMSGTSSYRIFRDSGKRCL